jgi:hypothetical protein
VIFVSAVGRGGSAAAIGESPNSPKLCSPGNPVGCTSSGSSALPPS